MNLTDELNSLYGSKQYPLHMPGHKRCDMDILSDAYHLDITEIEGYDNLYDAHGILQSAMEYAGKVYNCSKTYYLVNGSTTGILTAISSVADRGKRIIIANNCHRSVANAIELMNLRADYIEVSRILSNDVYGAVNYEVLEDKFAILDVCALVITSPSYDGIVSDIGRIVEICHKYSVPVIVDEAHGAHFSMDERLPIGALTYGADIVVHSTHKTLAAMTQTALLHVQGKLVDITRVEKYWSMFQTSSPSYVLMASIDSSLRQIQENGKKLWDEFFKNKDDFLKISPDLSCLHILCKEDLSNDKYAVELDPCKITIITKPDQITGVELQKVLLDKYDLQVELASEDRLIAIVTYADSFEGFQRFKEALLDIDIDLANGKRHTCEGTQASNANQDKKGLYAPCSIDSPIY